MPASPRVDWFRVVSAAVHMQGNIYLLEVKMTSAITFFIAFCMFSDAVWARLAPTIPLIRTVGTAGNVSTRCRWRTRGSAETA